MTASRQKEANQYAKRKKDGFKDQGLERVRKDTIKQKKKLHHVDDPDTISKRNLKRENLKNNKKKKVGGGTNSNGGGTNGGGVGVEFSQDSISAQRAKLKHVNR